MVLKFVPAGGKGYTFPRNYVWVIDVLNREFYAEFPDGRREQASHNDPFEKVLDGAIAAVAQGVWVETRKQINPHLDDEDGEFGHCDTCGSPCDRQGCTKDRTHVIANG